MEHERFKMINYEITGDETILDDQNYITPEVRRIIQEVRPEIEKGRKYLIKKLNRLCRKYPKTPIFKNFLSTVYQIQGNPDQAYAVNRWIVKEHPNYLFGKVNLAIEYLVKNQHSRIPTLLGQYMEISQLYPERKVFHVEEIIAYNAVGVEYFLSIDEIKQAEMRVQLLEGLKPDHPKSQYAQQILQQWYITKASERKEKEDQRRKEATLKDKRSHLQVIEEPNFHFQEEMNWLYDNDLSISRKKIEHILKLDEQLVVEDLEKIIQDSIARFDLFVEEVRAEGYGHTMHDFPIHALLLLSHFKNEKSISVMFDLLSQDNDFIDFWFGDFISDLMEIFLYNCGKNQIHRLIGFLMLPNVTALNKAVVGENLAKIIINAPGKKENFIEEYRQVLNLYIQNAHNKDFADTEAVGFVISDIIDLRYAELLPEIEKLFDLDLVSTFICGTRKEVESDISSPPYIKKMKLANLDVFKQYQEFNSRGIGIQNEDRSTDIYNQAMMSGFLADGPFVNSQKIGRNDPCPCGSGKKYKKCCMI